MPSRIPTISFGSLVIAPDSSTQRTITPEFVGHTPRHCISSDPPEIRSAANLRWRAAWLVAEGQKEMTGRRR
jgi:hypothetical protein